MSKLSTILKAVRNSTEEDLRPKMLEGARTGAEKTFRRYKAKGITLDEQTLRRETVTVINNKMFMSAMRESGITLEEVTNAIKEAFDKVSKESHEQREN